MNNVALAINLLTELLRQASSISALVSQAHIENRDLTTAELDAVAGRDDVARGVLVEAIERAKTEGR